MKTTVQDKVSNIGNENMDTEKNDIAIIGIACRFPEAMDYNQFFSNLHEGRNSIKEITPDRWDINKYYSPDISLPNKSISKWCGQVQNFKDFDNRFFNISPREAKNMDPQQRLLLEETWHCIEDSGIKLEKLQRATTSVYVGVMATDYHQEASQMEEAVDSYAGLGNYPCILSNRISYAFGFEGSSTTIDAACASSLVAIHKAKASLRSGESDYAFASGVNLNFHPWKYISFSKSRMLSPDGQCKTFDKDANGYVPGDGIGIILLQRLEDAIRDGNMIYGVIKGSAVNHGGQAISITAPRVEAQKNVILSAYKDAGISPETVTYVEAHGTGTSLGDPIEVEALTKAFREFTTNKQFCKIGSVKTNIGHLEAAAGIAGVIKLLMMMKHKKLVKSLNVKTLNPIINFKQSPFSVSDEVAEWKSNKKGTPLRASVSSFGMGGVNSHVIIESFDRDIATSTAHCEDSKDVHDFVFPLSAKSEKSLQMMIDEWKLFIKEQKAGSNLHDIYGSLLNRQEHFSHRYGVCAKDIEELEQLLGEANKENFVKVQDLPWCMHIREISFSGYDQIVPLCKKHTLIDEQLQELYKTIRTFDNGDKIIKGFESKKWSKKNIPVNIFIINYALVECFKDLGVVPDILSSEKDGGWVALVTSEVMPLQDVVLLLAGYRELDQFQLARPKIPLYDPLTGNELMPFRFSEDYFSSLLEAVNFSSDFFNQYVEKARLLVTSQYTFKKFLEEWDQFLLPKNIQLSAMLHDDALLKNDDVTNDKKILIVAIMTSLCRLNKKWNLSEEKHADHEVLYELIDLIVDELLPKEMVVDIFTDQTLGRDVILERLNQNQKNIHLEDDKYHLLREKNTRITEIANHKDWLEKFSTIDTALPFGKDHLTFCIGCEKASGEPEDNIICLNADSLSEKSFNELLVPLWLQGSNIRWEKIVEEGTFRKVALPLYPFEAKTFWINNKQASRKSVVPEKVVSKLEPLGQDLLQLKRRFSLRDAIAQDHVITGKVIIPGAAMVETCWEAVKTKSAQPIKSMKNVTIKKPGFVDPELDIVVKHDIAKKHFSLLSNNMELCEGSYDFEAAGQNNLPATFYDNLLKTTSMDTSGLYQALAGKGYQYGKSLQVIKNVWQATDGYIFELQDLLGEEGKISNLSPHLLDGIFQAAITVEYVEGRFASNEYLYVPFVIKSLVQFHDLPDNCFVHIAKKDLEKKGNDLSASFNVYAQTGEHILSIDSMLFKYVPNTFLAGMAKTAAQNIPVTSGSYNLYEPVWISNSLTPANQETSGRIALSCTPGSAVDNNFTRGLKNFYKRHYELAYAKNDQTLETTYENNIRNILKEVGPEGILDIYFSCVSMMNKNQSVQQLSEASIDQIHAFFCLAKALSKIRSKNSINIIVVTNNAQLVVRTDNDSHYADTSLLGLAKTLKTENKSIRCTCIDIDYDDDKSDFFVKAVVDECLNNNEEVVAYRKQQRYVRTVAPAEEKKNTSPVSLKNKGVYVLIGGAGGIGAKIAHSIADQVKATLVLVGRSPLNESKQSLLDRLSAKGCTVKYAAVDITNYEKLKETIDAIKKEHGPISGLIQSSGVLEDTLLMMKEWDSFKNVISPKILGTMYLHDLTKEQPLDFFMVFSSVVSILGNMGQADYATANSFLDGFIQHRSFSNCPGKSIGINWTLWADGGMGLSESVIKQLGKIGLDPIDSADAITALWQVLREYGPQIIILKGDYAKVRQVKGYTDYFNAKPVTAGPQQSQVGQAIPSSTAAADAVEQKIITTLSEVISVPADEIDNDTDFNEYGMDSVAIMEMVDRLSEQYGDSFYHSIVIENPTVNQLASYIRTNILGATAVVAQQAEVPAASATIAAVNDEQIAEGIIAVLSDVIDVPASEIDRDTDFNEYGVDSVAIMEMVDRLSEQYGDSFYHSIVIENPTVNQLTAYIKENLQPQQERMVQVQTVTAPVQTSVAAPSVASAVNDEQIAEGIISVLSDVIDVPASEIDRDTDFNEYGVDSVAIMEMVDRLSEQYGDSFYHSIVIENPTVNQLTAYIKENLQPQQESVVQVQTVTAPVQTSVVAPSVASAVNDEQIAEGIIAVLSDVIDVPASEIDRDTDFNEYGVDSVAIMEMVDRLSEQYGDSFYHSIVIENPTVNQLTAYIKENLQPVAVAPQATIPVQDMASLGGPASIQVNVSQQAPASVDLPEKKHRFEPIAVVGMSGRFPGSPSLEMFWDHLKEGNLLISEVPFDRFPINDFFDPEKGVPQKTYSRWAGLMEGVSCFDAAFFKIRENEAIEIDPQQRMFLEIVQELWDRSGYRREEIAGTNTGVFVGGHESNYGRKIQGRTKYNGPNGVPNVISNLIAGRIMHHFDLRGPAVMVYSACSSSLVALHKACRSLQLGECDMAIAGGIELLLDEEWFIGFSESKVLSPEGKCKVFDKSADGFVLGEGVGAVLLKTLSQAIADGDQILGVIDGSAVNNDGQTMGLTTPNIHAQKDVIQRALDVAEVDPSTISYYEAHGTATPLGDPIEVKATTQIFQQYTQEKGYCAIGSVKSNIGHLLSAAGIASFIKVILSLQHKLIPPTINCQQAHPRFDFEKSPFFPNTQLREWQKRSGIRRAAISSFGFGGTNCHLIVHGFEPQEHNYVARRQALPVTPFNRKHYWIGEPITSEKELLPYKIFSNLEYGNISIEEAKARARAWEAIY